MKELMRILTKGQMTRATGYVMGGGLGIWFIASFININAHNMTDNVYAAWNIFTLLF